jgi:hypothetical protein
MFAEAGLATTRDPFQTNRVLTFNINLEIIAWQ